jgi:hypothetical protein
MSDRMKVGRRRHPHPDPRTTSALPSRTTEAAIVFLFCCTFAFLVIRFASVSSAAYDETTHLTSGYTYWKWDDYRLNPEHPPLVKKLAALPLLTVAVKPETVDLQSGDEEDRPNTTTERSMRRFWALGLQSIVQQWNFAQSFLYGPTPETQARLGLVDPHDVPGTTALEKSAFQNDAQALLFRGRMPIMLLGCALLTLVYLWGRQMFGVAGGVLGIALVSFDPNVIAHSGLVTMDIGVTLFMFAAMFFLWCAFRRLAVWSVVLFMISFGLAFATKFSAVLLGPCFWLVAAGRIMSAKEWPVGARGDTALSTVRQRAAIVCGLFAGTCLTTVFVIWALYGFRFSAAKDPERAAREEAAVLGSSNASNGRLFYTAGQLPLELVVRRTAVTESLMAGHSERAFDVPTREEVERTPVGFTGSLLMLGHRMKLLPEAYLYGLAVVRMTSLMRSAYLGGEISPTGFRSYFLWTFLLKTPVPALLLIVGGIVIALWRRMPWQCGLLFLAVPVVVYLAVSLSANLNIGHRHLLPIYPFLYVLSGVLTVEWAKWRPRTRRWTATVTLLSIVACSTFVFAPPWQPQAVYPHYLAYFNEFAGGPMNGYKSLVDSNLDWGQDLIGLKRWLETNQMKDPIILSYFGMGDPRFYGIAHVNAPRALGGYGFEPAPAPNDFLGSLKPGQYFAISATNRAGVYLPSQAAGIWNDLIERSAFVDQIGYSLFIYRLERPR